MRAMHEDSTAGLRAGWDLLLVLPGKGTVSRPCKVS